MLRRREADALIDDAIRPVGSREQNLAHCDAPTKRLRHRGLVSRAGQPLERRIDAALTGFPGKRAVIN